MNFRVPGNHTTAALLASCGLLTLTIVAQVALPGLANVVTDTESADASIELPVSKGPTFIPRPLGDYSEVLERPLLFSDRRMPPEPEVQAAPVIRSPLRLKLEGVAISADSRVALLRNTADNQLLQLAEGTSHDGWTLEKLSTSGATFRRGEEVTEIVLEVTSNGQRRR
jgi:hypothetical protein